MKTNNNTKSYRDYFQKYGISYKSLKWNTKIAQAVRYRELLKDLDLKGKSILDFGCGMGDIVPVISANTQDFEYLGVDVVPEFIVVAREAYKIRTGDRHKIKIDFSVRDLLKKSLRKIFDVVLSSGALNSNVIDALEYRKKAIKILWNHAREVLAFNMSGGYPQPENSKKYRVFYANSMEILEYCLTLTSKIIFRHHYRKRDFTIIMYR